MPVDRRYGFDMILILIQYIWGWVLARWGGLFVLLDVYVYLILVTIKFRQIWFYLIQIINIVNIGFREWA